MFDLNPGTFRYLLHSPCILTSCRYFLSLSSGRESSTRLRYQDQTDGNYRELVKLIEAVTAMREHQSQYEDDEAELKLKVEELESKLVAEKEEKIELRDQTNKLRNSLEVTTLKIQLFCHRGTFNDVCQNKPKHYQKF